MAGPLAHWALGASLCLPGFFLSDVCLEGVNAAPRPIIPMAAVHTPPYLQTLRNKEMVMVAALDWAKGPCGGAERVDGLDGQSEAAIEALLGRAEASASFRMHERPGELHIVLQNHYPLRKAENRDVEIREHNWTKGDCRLTIWFHRRGAEWTSFENRRYSKDAEF